MLAVIFSVLSVLAVTAGGLLSAFTARRATRLTAWAAAYLVLVAGVIQLELVSLWHRLGQPRPAIMLAALLLYNLGHLGVLGGTAAKTRRPWYSAAVSLGGLCIAIAMALALAAARSAHRSWPLAAFIALAAVILISMPIGLMLASKRSKEVSHVHHH